MQTENPRVLNGLGAFASLYDIDFPKLEHPLLVLKSEEPGSKQKLAMEYGYTESICYDMINHLVNDIYILTASIVGIVGQKNVIDGSKIREGNVVLAIASNGLHTNGYSLVRMMMERYPHIKLDRVDSLTFMEQIMKPHTPYYKMWR